MHSSRLLCCNVKMCVVHARCICVYVTSYELRVVHSSSCSLQPRASRLCFCFRLTDLQYSSARLHPICQSRRSSVKQSGRQFPSVVWVDCPLSPVEPPLHRWKPPLYLLLIVNCCYFAVECYFCYREVFIVCPVKCSLQRRLHERSF